MKLTRAYNGVTGTPVRHNNKSVKIRLRRKMFRAERRRLFWRTAMRTPPFPTKPKANRVP